ncbi:unnamed protein product [marine sediment metagenome]|uniref:Uncharacterized protein n=1 Tax=marine sediment metagenome TaxID=412755 RepID=X1M789_9ZZZZ
MAGERGFEPLLADSESTVLPLDDSPKVEYLIKFSYFGVPKPIAYNSFLFELFSQFYVLIVCYTKIF